MPPNGCRMGAGQCTSASEGSCSHGLRSLGQWCSSHICIPRSLYPLSETLGRGALQAPSISAKVSLGEEGETLKIFLPTSTNSTFHTWPYPPRPAFPRCRGLPQQGADPTSVLIHQLSTRVLTHGEIKRGCLHFLCVLETCIYHHST